MFRADRIGTPVLHQANTPVTSVANPALQANSVNLNVVNGHQVNAVNVLDFGVTNLQWVPATAPTLADGQQVFMGQVVTLTPPIAGDAFGFELIGGIRLRSDASLAIVPIFVSLSTITGTLLGQISSLTPYAQIAEGLQPGTAASANRNHFYKTQVVHNTPSSGIVIAHGFLIQNASGAGRVLTSMTLDFGVRQLNDQQSISYRDTRR